MGGENTPSQISYSVISAGVSKMHAKLPRSWETNPQYFFAYDFERQLKSPCFFREILPKAQALCAELALRKSIAIGEYRTGLSSVFRYNVSNEFDGLFLGVCGKDGRQVGVLDFRIGFPVEIISIQGIKGEGPKEFYHQTGYHYDHVLMNLLCNMVARHFRFEESSIFYGQPRIVFNICQRTDGIKDRHLEERLLVFLDKKVARRQGLYPGRQGVLPFVKNHFIRENNRLMAKLAVAR